MYIKLCIKRIYTSPCTFLVRGYLIKKGVIYIPGTFTVLVPALFQTVQSKPGLNFMLLKDDGNDKAALLLSTGACLMKSTAVAKS